ncbi:MAG: cation transporter [Bacteroidales bacterium]|nr:cation transporter [Bacteroidales bacterium]
MHLHEHKMIEVPAGKRGRVLTKVIWVGLIANLFITVGKIVAGWLGRSAALVSSGIHSLSDLASDAVVLILLSFSARGECRKFAYGRGKFESLASAVIGGVLFFVAVDLLVDGIEAIEGILSGELTDKPSPIALWMAVASMAIQLCVYFYTSLMGHKYASSTLVAKSWHNLVDAVSTLGALLAVGLAIVLGDKWVILDPLAACIISVAVLVLSVKVLIPALQELLDAALPQETEEEIRRVLLEVGAQTAAFELVSLKTRRSGPDIFVDAVLKVAPETKVEGSDALCDQVQSALRKLLGASARISLRTVSR